MIKAVMFDMGGTIEDLYADEKNEKATALALDRILKSHGLSTKYGAEELWSIVGPQILAYKKQSEKTMIELKPEEIWPDYGFKGIDIDREKLIEISEEIAAMWEVTAFDRKLRPHVKELLKGLKEDAGVWRDLQRLGNDFQIGQDATGLFRRDPENGEVVYGDPTLRKLQDALNVRNNKIRVENDIYNSQPHNG